MVTITTTNDSPRKDPTVQPTLPVEYVSLWWVREGRTSGDSIDDFPLPKFVVTAPSACCNLPFTLTTTSGNLFRWPAASSPIQAVVNVIPVACGSRDRDAHNRELGAQPASPVSGRVVPTKPAAALPNSG